MKLNIPKEASIMTKKHAMSIKLITLPKNITAFIKTSNPKTSTTVWNMSYFNNTNPIPANKSIKPINFKIIEIN